MGINKNDIFLLMAFLRNNKVNELQSYTVSSLMEEVENKYSHTKIRNGIKFLINVEYLKEGFKQGNSRTYYITKKGIEFLNSFRVSDVNNDYEGELEC